MSLYGRAWETASWRWGRSNLQGGLGLNFARSLYEYADEDFGEARYRRNDRGRNRLRESLVCDLSRRSLSVWLGCRKKNENR